MRPQDLLGLLPGAIGREALEFHPSPPAPLLCPRFPPLSSNILLGQLLPPPPPRRASTVGTAAIVAAPFPQRMLHEEEDETATPLRAPGGTAQSGNGRVPSPSKAAALPLLSKRQSALSPQGKRQQSRSAATVLGGRLLPMSSSTSVSKFSWRERPVTSAPPPRGTAAAAAPPPWEAAKAPSLGEASSGCGSVPEGGRSSRGSVSGGKQYWPQLRR